MSRTNIKPSSRSRATGALVSAIAAIAIAPATAAASTTWFGSSLDHDPANAGSTCSEDGVGQPGDVCTHVASDYPGFSGHAKSPVTGTVIALKLEPAGPITFRAEIVSVRKLSSDFKRGQARATARSRKFTLAGPTQDQISLQDFPIDTVHLSLKVRKGQELAINTASNTAEYCSDSTPGQLLFDPTLSPGGGFTSSAGVDGCLMLFQAVVRH
jgi:hypothetical protein